MSNKTDEDILNELNQKNTARFGVTIAYCAIVIMFAILGNIFSFVFYRFKARRTTTNLLLTWLTAMDLCSCIIFIDVIVKLCFSINFPDKYVCKITYVALHFLVSSSNLLLLAIGVDRFRKLCRPLKRQCTLKLAKIVVGVAISSAFLLSSRYLLTVDIVSTVINPETGQQIDAHQCTHTKDPNFEREVFVFHLIDMIKIGLIMLSLVVLYSLIAKNLWTHRKFTLKNNRNVLRLRKRETAVTGSESHPESTVTTVDKPEKINEPKLSNRMTMPDMAKQEATTEDLSAVTNSERAAMSGATGDLRISSLAMEKSCDSEVEEIITQRSVQRSYYADRQVTLMMLAISLAFIFSYLPYFTQMLMVNQSTEIKEHELGTGRQIAIRSFLINNAINPYIQAIFNPEFRRFAKKFFCTLCCVKGGIA